MTQIQFGFILPQVPPDKAGRARFVEDVNRALGLVSGHFESARMIDHLGNNAGDMESFTTLAYFAALHPQLKFGHTVLSQTFRNPALVAMMGAAFQFLSGGRFLLGIGAGGDAAEHKAFGYDFPPAPVRVSQLEEALQIIKGMWTEPKVTFLGEHYRVEGASCEPKPEPVPPIMVGAFKPKMLGLTAKYADEWNVSSTGIHRYRQLVEGFERACGLEGRDPATVRRSWGGGCICRATQADAERLTGTRYNTEEGEDFDFVGTPQLIIEQMKAFIDLGVTSFMFDCGGFPDLTTLELLIGKVLPAVNH
jgi:alkanesulfonate monooxygenase SsuD/methylene tetrahydromethanopterin reductase-like flavin-dependent oxidoreductase (luciferase family)